MTSTTTEQDVETVKEIARTTEPSEEMLLDHLIGLTANAYTIMTLLENMEYALPETRTTTLVRLARGYLTTASRINDHVQKFIETTRGNNNPSILLTDT